MLPATLDSFCGESHEGNAAMLAAFIGDLTVIHLHVVLQCLEGTLLL